MISRPQAPWAQVLAQHLERVDPALLRQSYADLSARYRNQTFRGFFSKEERLAYMLARLPATYAVNRAVLGHLDLQDASILDLGCGPGAASLAALAGGASRTTLVEQDGVMLDFAGQFCRAADLEWDALLGAFEQIPFPDHDVVVASYVLNELSEQAQAKIIARAWQAARQALVLIEPGTPQGFHHIRLHREALIKMGAYMVAPCTHANTCPLATSDWCHFAARVPRTAAHRYLKEGDRGHEDEKYSFLIVSKQPLPVPEARVIKPPRVRGGHVMLDLCAAEGLQTITIGKSQKATFRTARKAAWGDGWPQFEDDAHHESPLHPTGD
ncbi:MAG: small ribosomal subunit Rsm22 family protein [Holosporales bacterium]